MSTKKFNINLTNVIFEKLLWFAFIKYKVISYEENLKNIKVSEIKNNKNLIISELESLHINTDEASEEELLAYESKKLELESKILELEILVNEIQELFNQKVKNIYTSYNIDVLSKYFKIFKEFNYKEDFNLFSSNYNCDSLTFPYANNIQKTDLTTIFKQIINSQNSSNVGIHLLLMLIKNLNYKISPFNKNVKKIKRRAKKLWKKLRSLRKLKKLNILKKKKNYNYLTYFNFLINFRKKIYFKNNILLKKIPLSKRVVIKNNLEFFYKLHKHTKKNLNQISNGNTLFINSLQEKWRIYLRNFHQQPYFKLRKARVTHWGLFYKKTIKKQRYKGFIAKFLKNYSQLSYNYSFFLNFFLKTYLSWTRFSHFESFFKSLIVEKTGSVLKLPCFLSNIFNWNILKKKNYILKKKIGRWSYLGYKRSQLPWLQTKKNSPKAINHIQPNFLNLTANCTWDVMTNTLYLHKEFFLFTFPTKDNFKVNWQIKLHMYRYKANN